MHEAEHDPTGQDLLGRVVFFKEEVLKVPPREHPFLVTGGFGAHAWAHGSAIAGVFLSDGERTTMRREYVDRIADERELTAIQLAVLSCVQPTSPGTLERSDAS